MSGEVAFAAEISQDRKLCSIVAAGRERARVRIDPNVRVRGNMTYSGLDDITGSVAPGDTVEVYEPESGLAGDGVVTGIDKGRELVYLMVDWPSLAIVPSRRGLTVTAPRVMVVDLVWYEHPRDAVKKLDALYVKHDPVAVVVDPRSQAGTLLKPLAEAGLLVTQPGTADVAVAHGEFLDLVNDGRLAHLDQPPLTAAVRAAQQRPLAGAQAWERKVTVDQSPLVAATLACWAFLRWEELSQPGVWVV